MVTKDETPSAVFSDIDISGARDERASRQRPNRLSAALQMRASGKGVRQIAGALDVPRGLVSRWIDETAGSAIENAPTRQVKEASGLAEPAEGQKRLAQTSIPTASDGEPVATLRIQFRACMAQLRTLAERIERIESREQSRVLALETELREVNVRFSDELASLRAELLALQGRSITPDTKPSRLAFWRGRVQ